MLDPYYRTIDGFQVLVQREWMAHGHKFADRCGHGVAANDLNERSPVFLQWLDCIYQLLVQNPTAFEFNEMFLVWNENLESSSSSSSLSVFLLAQASQSYIQLFAWNIPV